MDIKRSLRQSLPAGPQILDRLQWRVRLMNMRRQGRHRVALASFPRSGNTWVRFLLENATGELTGNSSDRNARILARPKEGLVIKTHRRDSHRYTRAIHLVRNPFDVVDSYYAWKASLGWSWKYGELSWDEFVKLTVPLWRQHTRHWLDAAPATFRIRYEDCLSDPVGHFGSLLEWLERPVSPQALGAAIDATSFDKLKRQQSAQSAVVSKFFRQGQAAKGIHRFSPEQRQWVVDCAGVELERCGYSDLIERSGTVEPSETHAWRDA
jgi:hypothetical protein